MIPILLVIGLLAGRWWAVPVVAVGWPVLLLTNGQEPELLDFLGAAGVAVGNMVIGVLVHRGIASIVEDVR